MWALLLPNTKLRKDTGTRTGIYPGASTCACTLKIPPVYNARPQMGHRGHYAPSAVRSSAPLVRRPPLGRRRRWRAVDVCSVSDAFVFRVFRPRTNF